MGNTFYFQFEPALMEWLQGTLGVIGTAFFSFITLLGESGILVAVIAVFYLGFDKELGRFIGTNVVCATAWNPLIKNLALRRRPYFDNSGIECLKPVNSGGDIYDIAAQGYSFPSGHAMSSAATYGTIALRARIEGMDYGSKTKGRILWLVAFFLPFIIGLSRVVLGVHYPTDVIFGWAAGYAIAIGLSAVQKKVKNHNLFRLILVIITLPGIFYCHTDDYYSSLGLMIGLFIAFWFEEKYVNFPQTNDPLVGAAIFLGLNALLKLPFSEAFLESETGPAFMVRALRYGIATFTAMGLFPMTFKSKLLSGKL